jgi:hypothetical protein
LDKLHDLIGLDIYGLLGFSLDLKTGNFTYTQYTGTTVNERTLQIFSIILTHYASGKPRPPTCKLVKFKDLPGGYAYEGAFNQRAIQPIIDAFGTKPDMLVQVAELLGGARISVGGDVCVQIPTLKGIPLTYILWKKDEFDASATVLYDESASSYLPTEDLSSIGEITTSRILETKQLLE